MRRPPRAPLDAALALLGLPPGERDAGAVRAAYLAAIRTEHPDVSAASDAASRAAGIIEAYETVLAALDEPEPTAPRPAGPSEPSGPTDPTAAPPPPIRLIDDDTIEVQAPLDLVYGWLVQAGHLAGDITFLDRSAPILQVLVSFVDEPPCQVIFDLQGRAARGTTEIFCTVESLEDRPPPPIDAVTRFVAEQLLAVVSA